jgi:hypothetical protein
MVATTLRGLTRIKRIAFAKWEMAIWASGLPIVPPATDVPFYADRF